LRALVNRASRGIFVTVAAARRNTIIWSTRSGSLIGAYPLGAIGEVCAESGRKCSFLAKFCASRPTAEVRPISLASGRRATLVRNDRRRGRARSGINQLRMARESGGKRPDGRERGG